MLYDANELAVAIVFFDENGLLCKQMQLNELQAVLDGYVPLTDLANQVNRACYVEFNSKFDIRRVVCFKLPVSITGEIERSWHLPLMDLAASGAKSIDLGAGPIQLVCYSQTPSPALRAQLWDPKLDPIHNQLKQLKDAVKANRLGICFREFSTAAGHSNPNLVDRSSLEAEITSRLRKEYAQEFRDHMAQLLKEQRLRSATAKSEFDEQLQQIKLDYDKRIEQLKLSLADVERKEAQLAQHNSELKLSLHGQVEKISAMREYFEGKLEQKDGLHQAANDLMRVSLEAELNARFEAERQQLQESLQAREVELLYRNELEAQLQEEIIRLRDENQRIISNTGEQLLGKLVETGISFVSFQPGTGHLTVPLTDIARYLENPTSYVAEQCGVTEQRYQQWLHHYRMPVCQNVLEERGQCGENIARIEQPIDFIAGESDCCPNCLKLKARSHLRLAGI